MISSIAEIARLARAGFVLARYGVQLAPKGIDLPAPARWTERLFRRRAGGSDAQALSGALAKLGPSYIKLGQFLATRDDLVGEELARDLAQLQDKLPPFPMAEAEAAIEDALGAPTSKLFEDLSPPVAAASIAQVHRGKVADGAGPLRDVAVKILRPGIEQRFAKDLRSFRFAARQIERWHPPTRRLRPVDVVATLARSVTLEMDLRLEAAAISEMAENTRDDPGFRVPAIDWRRTARRVLTTEWIDGIPMREIDRLKAAGFDLDALGETLIQSFLRHAMRDGFFHADMHQGNLFVDAEGRIVAVDFGIMGRLSMVERRFLAEILYGFLKRDYTRVSEVHFEAGYVPNTHSVAEFAQALRAIGEPLMDRTAEEISMGTLLGQLFQYTDVFDMATRTELILLQKTMVVVEGVARTLNPKLNMWTASEPVVREWIEGQMGAEARLQEVAEGAGGFTKLLGDLPLILTRAERTAGAFRDLVESGLRLDDRTIEHLATSQARQGRWGRAALWVGALSLAAIAVALFS